MSWTVRTPDTLDPAERIAWDEAIAANASLDSPYFRPGWWDAVGRVGRDVRVAVWTGDTSGTPDAFLPFEHRRGEAHPVGGLVNDYQALIARDDRAQPELDSLLRATDVRSVHFDHLLAGQSAFRSYHESFDCSPYVDLSSGLKNYEDGLDAKGRSDIKTARRKGRKLEREIGPLRFTWSSTERDAVDQLFDWKSRQYLETGVPDVFSHDWCRDLLLTLADTRDADFAGVVSTLHAGDELVAVHFGLRAGATLHWWFPTYNPDFGRYSPGRVLLQRLIDESADHGVSKIDFGKGMSSYKRRLMSDATQLATAIVEPRSLRRTLRQSAAEAKAFLKRSPLRRPLSVPGRWLHHLLSARAMQ